MKRRILTAALLSLLAVLTSCASERVLDTPPTLGSGAESQFVADSVPDKTEQTSEVNTSDIANDESFEKAGDISGELFSAPVESGTVSTAEETEVTSVKSESSESVINETKESEAQNMTGGNMENSILLFDKISAEHENSMFSPLSLNMALGLLQAGAGGSSEKELEAYLGTDSYADFAEGYMEKVSGKYNFRERVYGNEYFNNRFEIANSLWADNALPLKPEYTDGVSEKFGAEIRNLDLNNKEKTLKSINGWVKEKTHELIPSVLNDYSEDTAVMLINTVYFESNWRDEWDFIESDKQTFTLLDGSTKGIPLMRNSFHAYYENEAATAFSAGYRNGMMFIGILPKNEGDFTLSELNIPSLLKSKSYDYEVRARMPRLNYETNIPLTELLKEMGLKDIFSTDKADLSGISEQPLFVSNVLQKTKLELDEYGTKAAAITMVAADGAGSPNGDMIKEVFLNRPFAFLIYDESENRIVFIGKVTNP